MDHSQSLREGEGRRRERRGGGGEERGGEGGRRRGRRREEGERGGEGGRRGEEEGGGVVYRALATARIRNLTLNISEISGSVLPSHEQSLI